MKITNNTKIIIALLISLIFLQGCDGTSSTHINFYQGSQGIEARFLNNAPPRTITEETTASVMVEVWNKGAHTVPPMETLISLRYDPVYFKLDNTDPNFFLSQNPTGELDQISGKSESWPRGEYFILPLTKLVAQKIPGTRESPTTNIELVSCYSYKTYFSEMICLDTDIYEVDNRPICRNRERFTYSNQGAPVAINRLEVDMLPMGFFETTPDVPVNMPIINESGELIGLASGTTTERLVLIEPVIRIYARNVGGGDIFIPKEENIPTSNLCSFIDDTFKFRDHNKVKLTKATLDGLDMDCGEKTTLNLANPSDFITCRLHINQTGYLRQNLAVPLSIELDYHYRHAAIQQIRIQRKN